MSGEHRYRRHGATRRSPLVCSRGSSPPDVRVIVLFPFYVKRDKHETTRLPAPSSHGSGTGSSFKHRHGSLGGEEPWESQRELLLVVPRRWDRHTFDMCSTQVRHKVHILPTLFRHKLGFGRTNIRFRYPAPKSRPSFSGGHMYRQGSRWRRGGGQEGRQKKSYRFAGLRRVLDWHKATFGFKPTLPALDHLFWAKLA